MAEIDKEALAVSSDIKMQLQPIQKKIDESSQLYSDVYRRYIECFRCIHNVFIGE